MEPENHPPETLDARPAPEMARDDAQVVAPLAEGPTLVAPSVEEYRGLRWIFIGAEGLRAGWSASVFLTLLVLFSIAVGGAFFRLHLVGERGGFTATSSLFGELVPFLAMLGAAGLMGLVEHRRILDYNLRSPRPFLHLCSGVGGGFLALSALVGGMASGGWLHFGPIGLSGQEIFKFAVLWAVAFLLVGCVEEGVFRCYLQFTLTRGVNFWWALGIVAAMCLRLVLSAKGNGVWGVYSIALLGLAPCLLLELKKLRGSNFWQAAWVTSTAFGFIHTGNNGENWIGIFAAGAIGFVFCVSVWLTGSAWWAIGCHAAWDWSETFFYGTADSGLVAKGHYLTTTATGNPLWSGGADGPEGSLLVLAVILLLLSGLVAVYGHRKLSVQPAEVDRLVAG